MVHLKRVFGIAQNGRKNLKDDNESHNARYELLFDLVLTLKPYIFNMHTVESHEAPT